MGFYLNLEEYQKKILFQKVNDSNSFIGVKLKAIEFLLSFWKGNKELHPPYMYVDDKDLHRVFLVNQDGKNIISFHLVLTLRSILKKRMMNTIFLLLNILRCHKE